MTHDEAEVVLNVLDTFATAHINETRASLSAEEVQLAVDIVTEEVTHGNEVETITAEVSTNGDAPEESDIPF